MRIDGVRFSAAATAERYLPGPVAARARPLLDLVDLVISPSDSRGEAGRMSLIAFAIRITSAVIAFASQVLMARWMGAFEYGIFVLVWVSMIILGNLSCLGLHTAVIRFILEYRETGRLDALRGVLFGTRLFTLLFSTLFAGIGIAIVLLMREHIEPYYVVPFVLGMVLMPMIALSDVLEGMARANAWPLTALAPAYILRPVLILVVMAIGMATGFSATAETAVLAAIVATYATTLFQVFTISTVVDRDAGPGPRPLALGGWLLVSLPIFLSEGFMFLLTNADVLVVGYYLEPDDVAVYFATVKTLALVHFVAFAVKAGVAQRYAQLIHAGNPSGLRAFALETVGWTFWPSLFMSLVVLGLGLPLLKLFGPGFDAGYPLLFVLVGGVLARAAVGPAESLLTMSGNQNICAGIYAATLAINLAGNALLIPVVGLWGAAIATAVAMLCEALMLVFVIRRRLGIWMVVFGRRPQVEGA